MAPGAWPNPVERPADRRVVGRIELDVDLRIGSALLQKVRVENRPKHGLGTVEADPATDQNVMDQIPPLGLREPVEAETPDLLLAYMVVHAESLPRQTRRSKMFVRILAHATDDARGDREMKRKQAAGIASPHGQIRLSVPRIEKVGAARRSLLAVRIDADTAIGSEGLGSCASRSCRPPIRIDAASVIGPNGSGSAEPLARFRGRRTGCPEPFQETPGAGEQIWLSEKRAR